MILSNEGILVILFVGLVAGWLAAKIVRGSGLGIIWDIILGIVYRQPAVSAARASESASRL